MTTEIPKNIKKPIKQNKTICREFIYGIQFITLNTSRDPNYTDNHLLSYLLYEYLQSIVSIESLVEEGIHNPCKRELRFILEMSLKLCYIQQKNYNSDINTKLESFKDILNSSNISIKKEINLSLIPKDEWGNFNQDVGRVYGKSSDYVHLSHDQIIERIELVDQGNIPGKESPGEITDLNDFIITCLSLSIVFLLHSVPEYVVEDLFVEPDGSSINWHLSKSKYIAYIDERYDYKHKRKDNLEKIKKERWNKVKPKI